MGMMCESDVAWGGGTSCDLDDGGVCLVERAGWEGIDAVWPVVVMRPDQRHLLFHPQQRPDIPPLDMDVSRASTQRERSNRRVGSDGDGSALAYEEDKA